MINVTKPFLPKFEEYTELLKEVWEREWLTNQGPCLQQLERELSDFLLVEKVDYVSNGTIAIQLALRALNINQGEIITTPFSYVATTSAILLEGCKPVFVDIDKDTLQINPDLIEEKITENTKAILAVHVFGLPCDTDKLEEISVKYNIPVIYDGAHAFGSVYKGKSLLSYGDVSTCSFHATKLFHTVEGGCVIAKDSAIREKIDLIKRFGHNGDNHLCLGTNAKNSEMHAAMGLVNIKYIKSIIQQRKEIAEWYDQKLSGYVQRPTIPKNFEYNYAYYPIMLQNEFEVNKICENLQRENINPRRYFYPSLDEIDYVKKEINESNCKISRDTSKRVLCLPFYVGLRLEEVDKITQIIINTLTLHR